jgi:hypothetical protein
MLPLKPTSLIPVPDFLSLADISLPPLKRGTEGIRKHATFANKLNLFRNKV